MKGFTAKHVPDQTGKTVFITGANTGLGYEAAKVLAGKNARVIIGCRSKDKAQRAREEILAVHGEADVAIVVIDLADLESVETAGPAIRVKSSRRSHDRDVARKLWDLSIKMTGVDPGI